jgi:hypothetical protein
MPDRIDVSRGPNVGSVSKFEWCFSRGLARLAGDYQYMSAN